MKKNPFDELIETWSNNRVAFRRKPRHLNFLMTNLGCPKHLYGWWINLKGVELDMFYYMRLLFAREMWNDHE